MALFSKYCEQSTPIKVRFLLRSCQLSMPWKDYKPVTADLKLIYQTVTEEEALLALDNFSTRWDDKYPQISRSWRAHWNNLNTLFNYLARSVTAHFTLKDDQAEAIITEVIVALKGWKNNARQLHMGAADIATYSSAFVSS